MTPSLMAFQPRARRLATSAALKELQLLQLTSLQHELQKSRTDLWNDGGRRPCDVLISAGKQGRGGVLRSVWSVEEAPVLPAGTSTFESARTIGQGKGHDPTKAQEPIQLEDSDQELLSGCCPRNLTSHVDEVSLLPWHSASLAQNWPLYGPPPQ